MEPGDFQFGQGSLHGGMVKGAGKALDGRPSWHEHFLNLWEIIKEAERLSSEDELPAIHKRLKSRHRSYIATVDHWLSSKVREDHDRTVEEKNTRAKAAALKLRYEKLLYRYCLCYLYLNRYLIHLRRDIETLIRHVPSRKAQDGSRLKLQDNVGFLLRRAYREKTRFVDDRARLENMHTLLKELEPLFAGLKSALIDCKGQEQGGRQYTAFRACLRLGRVEKATILAADWTAAPQGLFLLGAAKSELVKHFSDRIMHIFASQGAILRHGEQMALDVDDIRIMSSFVRISEERIDTFIQKYSLPFIEFKYKILLKQAYRLGTIGNFEKLFTAYDNIVTGLAQGSHGTRELQAYEGTVLRPAEYTVYLGATSISDIFDQSDSAASELKSLLHAVRTLFRK